MMLIDTHCHLDAAEFDADRDDVVKQSLDAGVSGIVLPAVASQNFDAVIQLSEHYKCCTFALGIHPMYVESALDSDLKILESYLASHQPVAIGEIGLDYYVYSPRTYPQHIARQQRFFEAQLKLAVAHHLPVLLHVRAAIDDVLKYLRRHPVVGGIAHAFNGSFQQAEQFIDLGFKLGIGGAMTYSRATKLRSLTEKLPLEAIVLETDAPDIPPSWLGKQGRNCPAEIVKIAQVIADLRRIKYAEVVEITGANALKVMPKLAELCTPVKVPL